MLVVLLCSSLIVLESRTACPHALISTCRIFLQQCQNTTVLPYNVTRSEHHARPRFNPQTPRSALVRRRHASTQLALVAQAATAEAVLQKADLREDLRAVLRTVLPKVQHFSFCFVQNCTTFACCTAELTVTLPLMVCL